MRLTKILKAAELVETHREPDAYFFRALQEAGLRDSDHRYTAAYDMFGRLAEFMPRQPREDRVLALCFLNAMSRAGDL